jgi:SpoVK/Ycf46/Vps4 family AAA+-type ATPase
MQELHDLQLLLKARPPILIIESLEEPRLVQLFTQLALRQRLATYQWTVTEGLRALEFNTPAIADTEQPGQALRYIKALAQGGCFLLLDFHPFLDDPVHVRLLKEIAQNHDNAPHTLVLISHAINIPIELRHLTARFELHLPDRAALSALIQEESQWWQSQHQRPLKANREAVELLANNLLGMSTSDARRLIRDAIQRDGAITHDDLPEVMKAKFRLMSDESVISYEHDTARFSDVAGLDNLKHWLEQRKSAYQGKTNARDRPKGIMLLGVQGCGKSLAAKAVAGQFGIPLLRLDFGALYNKFYGETEKNLRQALKTAEVMAPCALWMDEIEKGIAHGNTEDGVSQRLLATLLTWMAENDKSVFIVATANAIERLPPELLRKGRLDEIFFVDLPDHATRKAIFSIHLRQRNLAPSGFDLERLARTAGGFSGAGIEQVVVSALYAARAQGSRLSNRHLFEELERTRPLSVVLDQRIRALREWASKRTVAAG